MPHLSYVITCPMQQATTELSIRVETDLEILSNILVITILLTIFSAIYFNFHCFA